MSKHRTRMYPSDHAAKRKADLERRERTRRDTVLGIMQSKRWKAHSPTSPTRALIDPRVWHNPKTQQDEPVVFAKAQTKAVRRLARRQFQFNSSQ